MTLREAEAVLMALAVSLTWARSGESVVAAMPFTTDQWDGIGDDKLYRVYCFAEGADQQRPYRVERWKPDVEFSSRGYTLLDEAKRACERHALTEVWD